MGVVAALAWAVPVAHAGTYPVPCTAADVGSAPALSISAGGGLGTPVAVAATNSCPAPKPKPSTKKQQQQQAAAARQRVDKAADKAEKLATVVAGAAGVAALIPGGQPVAVVLGSIAVGIGAGALIGRALWGDPFADHDFKVIAKPTPVNIPTIAGSEPLAVRQATTAVLVAELKLAEIGQAYQTSLNRAIGANQAHSALWVTKQLAAAANYAEQGAILFFSLAGLRANVAQALKAAGTTSVTVGATSAAQRQQESNTLLAALPPALVNLFKQPPLNKIKLTSLTNPSGKVTTGKFSVASLLEPSSLASEERTVGNDLRSFVSIILGLKHGVLPAGL
jgi:hypothetical protein